MAFNWNDWRNDSQDVEVDVKKDFDVDIKIDVDNKYELDVDIYKDIDVYADINTDVDLKGNLAVLTGNFDNVDSTETYAIDALVATTTDPVSSNSFADVDVIDTNNLYAQNSVIAVADAKSLFGGTYTEIDITVEAFDAGSNISVIMESASNGLFHF